MKTYIFADEAVHMKSIPTLRGQVGSRFIAMSEENFRRRGSVGFSEEAANSRAILEKKSNKN